MKALSAFVTVVLAVGLVAHSRASEMSIEPGDVLSITVQGQDAYTRVVTVNSKGMIEYPFMSNVPVSGMSTGQLSEFITYKLASVVPRPVVLISIPQAYMIQVSVLGQVNNPGVVQLSTQSSVQEAIQKAGGGTGMARLDGIKIVREVEGNIRTQIVNLQEFMATGDPNLLYPLRDGDKLIVPGTIQGNRVNIMGAVATPGFYYIFENVRLLDVITRAGGFTPNAKKNQVWIVSTTSGESIRRAVNVDKFFKRGDAESNPEVYAGDSIFVPEKAEAVLSWAGFVQYARDITQLLIIYLTIVQIERYSD
ncbi:SLBB domain-containing protein [Candidatus Fermentibacteria bacterium]|nr:SLBB domain-containing protein [Candidatus Fermentibacteria bacterium]